jgi:hypothetical protein
MTYRSECTCGCHLPGATTLHCFPCCEPDPIAKQYRRLPDDWTYPASFKQGGRKDIVVIVPANWSQEKISEQTKTIAAGVPAEIEFILGPVESLRFAFQHMVTEAK